MTEGLSPSRQVEILREGAVQLIEEGELLDRLERASREGRPLRVKLGADPTAPDIHLGHAVVLRKLRQFQDLGHQVYFVVGDFTGRIGDPSGRSDTRPLLTEEQVRANARTYERQIHKILDPERTRVVFNHDWLGRLSFAGVVQLAAKYTVARMLERDDYSRRFKAGVPVYIHEFLYPLAQAYDSVHLRVDVEIGGSDQTFNFLATREIMRDYGLEPQIVLTLPLLEGLDGVEKMSKSLGNHVGIADRPQEVYGRLMSIPDPLIPRYFELCTGAGPDQVAAMVQAMARGDLNPRDAKARLAAEVVRLYHGDEAAREAAEEFDAVFRRGDLPSEVPDYRLDPAELEGGRVGLARLLALTGLAASASEARRLLAQGGVRVDGGVVAGEGTKVRPRDGMLLRVGKRKAVRLRLGTCTIRDD
ncbi:MAG: tyrosine--tRNA ligase [bacterium]|nr:tyrosine--tRNA ligase [bacterium]